MNHSKYVVSLPYGVGTLAWRRSRDLLVIRDHCRDYAAIRAPRGPYLSPLPGDYRKVAQ